MKRLSLCVGILVLSLFASQALASAITFDSTSLGGNTWNYQYFVSNDTLSSEIQEFTVFFEYGLYSNLAVSSSPSGWDSLVTEPVEILGIPQDGLFDSLALGPGIGVGQGVGGFGVTFNWLGGGAPAGQYFEIVDPASFDVLDSGVTTAAPAPVPEPGTLLLLSSGLAGIWGMRKRSKK